MDFGKLVLYVILGLLGIGVGLWLIRTVVATVIALIFTVVIPVAVIAAIGYVLYRLLRPKALGGSGRSLP